MATEYVCAHCHGRFNKTTEADDRAHAEAERQWGRRGDAPGMVEICDDCYREFLVWLAKHPEERIQ